MNRGSFQILLQQTLMNEHKAAHSSGQYSLDNSAEKRNPDESAHERLNGIIMCKHLFRLTLTPGSLAGQEAMCALCSCNLMCHASENFSNEINTEVVNGARVSRR